VVRLDADAVAAGLYSLAQQLNASDRAP
jgi:hypothetical protein